VSDVEHLLAEYIAEHRAGGEADPGAYLARAPDRQRTELAMLIDAYLTRAPRQTFDEERYRGSSAERTVDELERALRGRSGLWPALLPQLRDRAGLRRSELVERLAVALGVGNQASKVAGYYHQMEQGLLPAQGVSERVLEALGQIIGESAQALRESGRSLASAAGGPPPASTSFARRAYAEGTAAAPAPSPPTTPGEAAESDEVDELFRGG
jgi:hypothetical protein